MKRLLIHVLLLSIIPLYFTGCFSTPAPNERFYMLSGPYAAMEKGYGLRIQVAEFNAAAGYDTSRIAYRLSSQELGYWAYKQWVSEPSRMISEMVIRLLRASGRFAEVARGERLREPDAIVEATIDAIEEVDQAETWQARLAMTLNVKKGDSDKLYFRHAFDRTMPCAQKDLNEVAKNISIILSEEIKALGDRLARMKR